MERANGVEVVARPSKKVRRVDKRKKGPSKSVDTSNTKSYTIDTFDVTKPIDLLTDTCAMCKQGHDFGLMLRHAAAQAAKLGNKVIEDDGEEDEWTRNNILDLEAVWVSRYSLTAGKSRRFVHYACAVASPQVWLEWSGTVWKNVNKEVTRSNSMTCSECKLKGATIGCYEDKCQVVLHLPCALLNGYAQSSLNTVFLCKKHRIDGKNEDEGMQLKSQYEISRGLENVAVTFANSLDRNNPQTEIQYVTTNIDSDEFIRNARNVDSVSCCNCIDLCDDVNLCACIQQGRNYTYQGLFIPGSTHQMRECNFKCSCSYRRCTNRVAEKGLNFRLQVTRVKDGNIGHAAWNRNVMRNHSSRYAWGVKTLDFIPRYSFVCEVMGQIKPVVSTSTSSSSSSANVTVTEQRASSDKSSRNGDENPDWAIGSRQIRMRDWQSKFVVPKEEPVIVSVSIKDLLMSVSSNKDEYFIDLTGDDGDGNYDNTQEAKEAEQQLQLESIKLETLKRKRDDEQEEKNAGGDQMMADDAETLEVEKKVPVQLLYDNLCLDCSEYGNVGSFLRRRIPGASPMFIKQLVFNSNRTDAAPKLALFAARNIEANSELFL